VLEETDVRIAELKKDAYEFKRDIVTGAENFRTGKTIAEKAVRYMEEKLNAKAAIAEMTRQQATLAGRPVTKDELAALIESRIRDEVFYREGLTMGLDRNDLVVPFALLGGLLLFGWGLETWAPSLGTDALQMGVWGFSVSTTLLFHATASINSLAHLIGKRVWPTKDKSRNSMALALLTLGEGWHNNHHHFQSSARQGFFWWEIDISYYLIRLMGFAGIVWDIKPVPAKTYEHAAAKRLSAR
jgi:hypothetical protein